jgi:UDP-3-O-[3-hydroxymyristoyl] N-acetylglucosamine deacetylase
MNEIYQKTLSSPICFEGIGLHSGKISKVKILPGKENQGIVFRRIDLKDNNLVLANYKNVSSAKLCTTLQNKHGVKVTTVEHLLAALYIIGIDNALIDIDCEEIPIMDGSAKDFLNKLNKTIIKTLNKKRKYIKILEKFDFLEGEKKISIEPNSSFEVDFQLDYKNKIIGKQKNIVNFLHDDLENVSNSRTFCLYEDIEKIKKIGLAKGGSLDNAIVVASDKVMNDGGLRNEKEFVNHKILDLVGDFVLSGYRVLGKVNCYQGGHELTNKFLRKLLVSNNKLKFLEIDDILISKKISSNQPIKIAASA